MTRQILREKETIELKNKFYFTARKKIANIHCLSATFTLFVLFNSDASLFKPTVNIKHPVIKNLEETMEEFSRGITGENTKKLHG